ncbi:putative ribonuclease H-like domain-containing protein [Tanacetum coccineum]|uniref:Ribonuclease H-like domain-containing protein n=1 Tax=Tanacetum coccineum TaxID=301880 RepID=A0ABQ5I005_9ASTR
MTRILAGHHELGLNPLNSRFLKSYTGNFMPSKHDLSFSGLEEFVNEPIVSEPIVKKPVVETSEAKDSADKPKVVKKNNGALIIEDWVSDSEEEDVPQAKKEKKTVKSSFAKIEFVKSKEQVKSPRKTVNLEKSARPMKNVFNKAYSTVRRPIDNKTATKNSNFNQRVNTVSGKNVNTARPKAVVNAARPKAVLNAVKGNQINAVKASTCWLWKPRTKGNPQQDLEDKRVIDSGCSRHTTRNMSYLTDFEEIDGGYVAFGGNPKGGKITGRVPRKDNMYSVDLKNIVPKRAKRKNRTLIEAARTMLADSKLPTTFWTEAVNTACYVQNRVLVTKPHNKTPYELFLGRKPALGFMRPFGCPVTIINTIDHLGKFDGKANEGFFVRYSINSKAFRVFNSGTRIVEENLHVQFSDNIPNIAGSGPNWLFDIDALTKSMNYKPVVAGNQSNGNVGTKECDDAGKARMETVPGKDYILLPLWPADLLFSQSSKSSLDAGFKPSSDGEKKVDGDPSKEDKEMIKRRMIISTINVAGIEVNVVGAKTSIELLDDPNIPELEDIVYSDDDEDVGAEVDMNNLDAFMRVSPILTTRVHKDHPLKQIIGDLNSASQIRRMTKNLEEHGLFISVQQRTNHKDFQNCLFACFLSQEEPKKVINALKDPSWIEAMQDELLQFKLQKVWTLVDLPNGKRAIGTKWVYRNKKDERGIVIKNKARIEVIRLFLAYASFKDFVVYQMDVKSAFLYGKIEEEVYVCQPPGFEDPDFPDRRGKIDKDLFIKKDKGDILLVQVTASKAEGRWNFYQSRQCAYARYQVNPKVSHLHTVKRTFREAYTDSDYAGASLDKKSTTGGYQFLGCRLILWQCKKQTVVANSTTEAEYVAASSCCGQVLWIQNQLLDYGYNFMHTKIYIDNESTICIVKNPVFHSKTKHIEIRHHFIKDSNEKKLIQMIKIHTDKNVADLLTKAFDVSRFQYLIADDEEGTDCLPNAIIFEEVTRMGAKTTAWNEFSSTMASAIICLATNQKFNFSKYIFESMVKNLDNAGKFLMYPRQGKDFSRRETPLFPTMMVQAQEEIGEGSAMPTGPHHTPIITQPSSSQPQRKQKSRRPKEKDTQWLYVNQEDAVPIGRINDNIDADEELKLEVSVADPVITVGEVVTTVSTAATITLEEVTLAQALVEIKTSKPKAKGIVFNEPSECTTTTPTPIVTPQQSSQVKDKGKGKMVEAKPVKKFSKKEQIRLDEEVTRNLEPQLQAEEEERIAREKQEANVALIEEWYDIQLRLMLISY